MSELSERIDAVNARAESANLRYFATEARVTVLEGRMTTFEKVNEVEGKARKELLETIIVNQEKQEKRTRSLEIKVAAVVALLTAAKFFFEYLHR